MFVSTVARKMFVGCRKRDPDAPVCGKRKAKKIVALALFPSSEREGVCKGRTKLAEKGERWDRERERETGG